MSDSLGAVGGRSLRISLKHPQIPTVTRTLDTGTAPDTRHLVHIWSFSFTAPSSAGAGGGGGGGAGGGGSACRLGLSRLRTAHPEHLVGTPTTVLFSTTAAATA
jgi:hypothetical protein